MKFSKVSKFSLPTLVAAVVMVGFATSPTASRAECGPVSRNAEILTGVRIQG
jgi:hypothetical protein